jgi:hypothetical protein
VLRTAHHLMAPADHLYDDGTTLDVRDGSSQSGFYATGSSFQRRPAPSPPFGMFPSPLGCILDLSQRYNYAPRPSGPSELHTRHNPPPLPNKIVALLTIRDLFRTIASRRRPLSGTSTIPMTRHVDEPMSRAGKAISRTGQT